MVPQVVYFNRDILGVVRTSPALLSDAEAAWLHAALKEEADEFIEACSQKDLVESVDALIDSIYFAIGGLHRLGLSQDQIYKCFDAVHAANLQKKLGVKTTRPNDGSVADGIKPPDFVPPNKAIAAILANGHG